MSNRNFSAAPRLLLVLTLGLSAVLAAATAAIPSSGSFPDERHQYSYVKYLADNYGTFPIRYENIFTDKEGDPNHLIHPPLYYYLLATALKTLKPTANYPTPIVEADRYGRTSRGAVIPILRSVSLLLFLGALCGIYLIYDFLVEKRILHPWYAFLSAPLLVLIPSFTYIGASLNNDVLVFALTPFLTFCFVRFILERERRELVKLVALGAAGLLTKASIWPLVLGFWGLAAVALAIGQMKGSKLIGQWPKAWCLLASALLLLSVIQLGNNKLSYGSIQPSYTLVHQIPREASRFFKAEGRETEILQTKRIDVAREAGSRFIKTLAGTMGHTERFYAQNPERLLQILGLSLIPFVLVGTAYLLFGKGNLEHKFILVAIIGIPVLLIILYLERSYQGFKVTGYYAAQGRYLIPYVQVMLLGLTQIASSIQPTTGFRGWILKAPLLVGYFGLVFVLCRPFAYTGHSLEIYFRSDAHHLSEQWLRSQGYSSVSPLEAAPSKFREGGYIERSRGLLSGYYLMAWQGSELSAPITPLIPADAAGVVQVALWAKGDSAYGQPALIELSLSTANSSQNAAIEIVELKNTIEIYEIRLEPAIMAPNYVLRAKLLNHRDGSETSIGRFWRKHRVPLIFGLYVKTG